MKTQDVIEQLVGTSSGCDINDTFSFNMYDPEKFPGIATAEIDFEQGYVILYDSTHTEVKKFAIKATLESIDP